MPRPPIASSAEWREHVLAAARRSGIELKDSTADELALHLEDVYHAARRDGASERAARAAAIEALGDGALDVLTGLGRRHRALRTDVHRASDHRSFEMMTSMRMALGQLRAHPSTALLTVLVLGLGIGAATTIFTVVEAVVLRPLPYESPARLVTLWDTNVSEGRFHDPISPVNFSDQRELDVFVDAAAWWRPGVNLHDPGLDPVRVNTIEVSGNLFDVLGVRPQLGAGFPQDGPLFVPNERIAVISDRLWRSRYEADPSILGRQLSLSDRPYTIVGVMPRGFHYPDDIDVWERLNWDMAQHSRQARFMEAVARVSEDTTFEQAQSAVDALWTRLETESAGTPNSTGAGWGSRLVPLLDEQLGYYRPALYVLFGAVGLLLAVGVLNIGSLMLTRALSREREVAVRVAMGATPRQLVAQLLGESFVLSLFGAVLGVLAAAAALPIIVRLTPVDIPRLAEAQLSVRSLGVGIGIASLTTLFFGLVPALLLLRERVTTGLKSGERGSSIGARRIYSVLVASEVALACALLTSSALLVRTVEQMVTTPTGVRADGVLTSSIQLASDAYSDWDVVGDTHARVLSRIREQPGVEAAGATNFLPFEVGWRVAFSVDHSEAPDDFDDLPQAQMHSVSDGYFETMGATLASGRFFTSRDVASGPGVVVVNQSFVRQYLADRSPLGSRITGYASGVGPLGRNLLGSNGPYPMEVVGVVRDVRDAPLGQPVEAAFYVPMRQFPFRENVLAVRAASTSLALSAVRTALGELAPGVPLSEARTWDQRALEHSAEPRLLMTVLLFFGLLAAFLAAVGVYGLFSWSVALRRRELAIRVTLGAEPVRVGGLVVRQSVVLVGVGLLSGLAIVRLAEGVLARVLFEVSPNDLGSLAVASGLLLVAAVAACVPPALRAMRVDPVEGLRSE